MNKESAVRIGIAGLGAIGQEVALAIDNGLPGTRLVAVADTDRAAVEGADADDAEGPQHAIVLRHRQVLASLEGMTI